MEYTNLADLRRRMFDYSLAFVSREARIERDRLAKIETTEPPSVAEIERLAELYGLDADILAELPIQVPGDDGITVLALLDEFHEVSALSRRRLVAAANAARDVVELRAILNKPRGYDALHARHHPAIRGNRTQPFQQGADHAHAWRVELNLGTRRIASVRDFVRKTFPEVAVLLMDLGSDSVSGVSFVDAKRGPAIVLNTRGKNENPLVRRFSLLHELAHLLIDATRGHSLATISGFLMDAQLEAEQRANAFAVRFLCPERELRELSQTLEPDQAVTQLIEKWGVHYRAARLYLQNAAHVVFEHCPTDADVDASVLPRWLEAEDWGLDRFPSSDVPCERRTAVARLAAMAYSADLIGRDRFARFLGVTPGVEVERVVDFFGLDLPNDSDG